MRAHCDSLQIHLNSFPVSKTCRITYSKCKVQRALPFLFAFLYNQCVENVTAIMTNWEDNRKKHECESSVEMLIFIQSLTSCKTKNTDMTAVQDCGLKAGQHLCEKLRDHNSHLQSVKQWQSVLLFYMETFMISVSLFIPIPANRQAGDQLFMLQKKQHFISHLQPIHSRGKKGSTQKGISKLLARTVPKPWARCHDSGPSIAFWARKAVWQHACVSLGQDERCSSSLLAPGQPALGSSIPSQPTKPNPGK